MRTILFSLLLSVLSPILPSYGEAAPFALKEKYQMAHAGDFIVTEQDHTYSLLFIREITADHLLLEEIAAPDSQIDLNTIVWSKWVKAKAPGHTSWTLYEIDARSGNLIEAFSYSKRGWLFLDETQRFLSKLLCLPLTQLGNADRKKIGPQPAAHEEDRRAVWNPPLTIQGKKQPKPQFDVWKGVWPEDGTQMGKCIVELYFSKANPAFPFPYWIEIKSPHYAFKMRSVDSGSGIISAYTGPIPHRPPQFAAPLQKTEGAYRLPLNSPLYFQSFHLYAVDLSDPVRKTIPIPHEARRDPKSEIVYLNITEESLAARLIPNHRYQWVLIPEEDGKIYVESDEVFLWKLI
ncbi:MAG: hypothetical protein JSR39_08325 [Verrucomicrobia bacterium]|nr:hypothetical protein [Verrucomicrobiota bacterium]